MTGQPGLFELPDPPPAPTVRAPRDRGRRGELWTRTVIADLHVVDRRALRDAAHQRLSDGLTVELGPAEHAEDLLDPHEEVATSNAAAVRWWTDPTTGTWPQLAAALRLDAAELDASDEQAHRVRARWSVSVTITDIDLLRAEAPRPGDAEETFPDLWNRTADPYAPLAELPGVTWTPVSIEIVRSR